MTDNEKLILNKELVMSVVDAINGARWEELSKFIAADFVRHSNAAGNPGVNSRSDLIHFLRAEATAFPDGKEDVLDLVAENDKVAARHRFVGTQKGPLGDYPATEKVMCAEYLAIYRIEGGQIVEAWAEWDNLSGLKQLGHV